MRHDTKRAIGALISTSLALGLLAGPASAGAATTVYVAPVPATAAVTGGSCASPDFVSLQDAVSSVAPGSTVLVCPGTYRELVTVTTNGLTIRGTEPWKAVLRPPAVGTAGTRPAGGPPSPDLLLISGADGVTVQWLKLVAPSAGACTRIDRMILVQDDAGNAVIRANRITTSGRGDTFRGSCGYSRGVLVRRNSSAWVGYNLVQDFAWAGIIITDADSRATVVRNSLRFRHAGVTSTFSNGYGIDVSGAIATVTGNAMVGLASAASDTPRLGYGIQLSEPGPGTVVRGNLVRYAEYGLITSSATGLRVVRNELRDGYIGIRVSGSGNTFKGNSASGNSELDCRDVSTGSGSHGTANTWIDNTGVTSDPASICSPPAP